MLILNPLKTCSNTRFLFLILVILGLFITRLNCQMNIDEEEEDPNNLDDLNSEDESSGHPIDEENLNRIPNEKNSKPIQQSQPQNVIKQNQNSVQNLSQDTKTIEEHIDDSDDDIKDDASLDESDNDKKEDFPNDEEDDEDDIEKPNNMKTETQSTDSNYVSSRSKLLNIIVKPGILAGIVGGAIIGILTAILLIMFIVYRMRKKDEGSYALEETKKPLNAYDYRNCPTKEFYA